tara:strand:- start:167 stop:1006 length:840 start_codon:yes stop_codon:yes gene_type:complete
VSFFDSNTNAPKITYKDELETIQNLLTIPVDTNGNLPNIFFSGSASVIYLDELGQQYAARNPVGDEVGLGNFTVWSNVVSYDAYDITRGSDNKFYKSLTNSNQGNDPTTSAVNWEEIRFIGVWNTNITYAIGDVVQTTNGNMWKALTAASGNDPSADDGTNWLPAIDGSKVPEIDTLEALNVWINKNSDFTAVAKESYQIDGSANTVDVTLPVIAIGDSFIFHNESASTFTVQILNPSYTINGTSGTIAAGTDLELSSADSVQLVAKSTTVLEIVGAQA